MKKLLPPKLFYLSLLIMIILNIFYPIHEILPFPYNYSGILFLVGGLIISILGKEQFKKVGTNISTFNQPDKLVTDGLFRYSRNPMYLGFVLALLGIFLFMGTLSPLFIVLFFITVADRWYISFEEKALINKFPVEYTSYKNMTRRWI